MQDLDYEKYQPNHIHRRIHMWAAIAEEDIKCSECFHTIPAGMQCLSQMPVAMPQGFHRRKYDNFCVECAECKAQSRSQPCYVQQLSHWYTRKEKATGTTRCVYCGDAIPEGTRAVAQRLYSWPEPDTDSDSENDLANYSGTASGVAVGAAAKPNAAGWHSLSRATQRRFMSGGLGRGLGRRTPTMAQRLYEKEVPAAIRNMGEPAVKDYIKGKHFSHIRSVANAPSRAKAPGNVVLEDAAANLSRGSRNMTSAGRVAARSASRTSAIRTSAKAAVKGSAKAGFFAAATEAIVSIPENVLHYKRGRKSRNRAVKDTAKDTATAAGVGILTAGAVKGAAMVGISPTLGPAGPPLAVAGVGLMVGTTAYRLYKAAKRELPLDDYRVYFCKKTNCRKKYAQQVTNAALGRNSHGGSWAIALGLAGLATATIAAVLWLE